MTAFGRLSEIFFPVNLGKAEFASNSGRLGDKKELDSKKALRRAFATYGSVLTQPWLALEAPSFFQLLGGVPWMAIPDQRPPEL